LLKFITQTGTMNFIYGSRQGRINSEEMYFRRKLRKATMSFIVSVCPSVCPHGTTRLPLDGFSRNFIFEYFSKIYWENWSFIKLWQE